MPENDPQRTPAHTEHPARTRGRGVLVAVAVLLGSLGLFAVAGQDGPADGALAAVVYILAGTIAAPAYLLSAVGLGVLFRPLWRGLADGRAAQVGLGLSLQLTISHLMGWTGLFAGGAAFIAGAAPCALGLGILVIDEIGRARAGAAGRTFSAGERWWGQALVPWIFGAPGAALVLVGACNPPGWLWASEFGGYDALSYHLQLPQEWLAGGRLAPLSHNVYSYLPSAFESAFMHVAVLSGAPGAGGALLIGDGRPALACQMLHAMTTIIAAYLVARLARGLVLGAGNEADGRRDDMARMGASLAGALFLATPWVIVVGSLAYNEMALGALLAASLNIAADRSGPSTRRWLLSAWLVGIACGVKPTALLFAGAPVLILLLGSTPLRSWLGAGVAGVFAGVVALAPWLVRNALAGGNPVFPYLTQIFGTAHWSAEQVARYLDGHHADLSISQRLRLLVLPDPTDPAGARHRGLLHPQWAAFFPLVVASAGLLATVRGTLRRPGTLLALGLLAQIALWLTATHLQSRFLVPLAIPGAALFGLALGSLLGAPTRLPRPVLVAAAALPILVQVGASAAIFLRQHNGRPNQLLAAGPGFFSGSVFREQFETLTPEGRAAFLADASPEVYCGFTLGAGDVLYLLGDATPFYFTCPVVYHTTWDASPLGSAMRATPDDPAAWAAALRARGITHILYSAGEIDRLNRSGWYDPAVTTRTASRFLEETAHPVRSWPVQGRYLFRLR